MTIFELIIEYLLKKAKGLIRPWIVHVIIHYMLMNYLSRYQCNVYDSHTEIYKMIIRSQFDIILWQLRFNHATLPCTYLHTICITMYIVNTYGRIMFVSQMVYSKNDSVYVSKYIHILLLVTMVTINLITKKGFVFGKL